MTVRQLTGFVFLLLIAMAPLGCDSEEDDVAPHVTSVTPDSGSIDGGTVVVITGTDFETGATVTFGGGAATNVSVGGAISITATTAAHAAGDVDVSVINPGGGQGTLGGSFTYQ